jgi:protein phosphatase PTC7
MTFALPLAAVATLVFVAYSHSNTNIGFHEGNVKRSLKAYSLDAHVLGVGTQIGVGCSTYYGSVFVESSKSADTAENCGEDACFFSAQERALYDRYISFGVSGSVGGWATLGLDPSVFSKALCVGALHAFIEAIEPPRPLDLMKKGYEDVVRGGDKNAGGSTALYCVLDQVAGRLETANLGDSGYLIIRNGTIIFRSEAQFHSFSDPFQLYLSPSWKERQNVKRVFDCDDSFVASHNVEPGDVIILGTYGLFANMFDDDILYETESFLDIFYSQHPKYLATFQARRGMKTLPSIFEESSLNEDLRLTMINLSSSLTEKAKSFASYKRRAQPVSNLVKKSGSTFKGGYNGDITVVAVYVHPSVVAL